KASAAPRRTGGFGAESEPRRQAGESPARSGSGRSVQQILAEQSLLRAQDPARLLAQSLGESAAFDRGLAIVVGPLELPERDDQRALHDLLGHFGLVVGAAEFARPLERPVEV